MLNFTKRLRRKTFDLYVKHPTLPLYMHGLESTLSLLDEILIEYELNDHAYTREYTVYLKQWNRVERTFYNVMKRDVKRLSP